MEEGCVPESQGKSRKAAFRRRIHPRGLPERATNWCAVESSCGHRLPPPPSAFSSASSQRGCGGRAPRLERLTSNRKSTRRREQKKLERHADTPKTPSRDLCEFNYVAHVADSVNIQFTWGAKSPTLTMHALSAAEVNDCFERVQQHFGIFMWCGQKRLNFVKLIR